jgi:hypothetical protein
MNNITPTEFLILMAVFTACGFGLGYIAGSVRTALRNQRSPRFILK